MTKNDIPPDEAFALLGNEIRIDIIRVLGDVSGEPLSFSELREQVGTRDSGQFNYHLNQLVGTFVQRTGDGQYELAYAGRRVVGSIHAGDFNRRGIVGTFALESFCGACDTQLEATYEDEQVTIRCSSCDTLRTRFDFPPGGFDDRTIDELTRAFDGWIMGVLETITDGICFNCAGKTTGRLRDEVEPPFEDEPVYIEFTCERCNNRTTMSVNSYLLLHPVVIAFHYDHGIDVHKEYTWNLEFVHESNLRVSSENPLRIESILELNDDCLTLIVDENLTVHVE